MTDIFAVRPGPLGATAHLYVPGYQPGRKRRRPGNRSPLCGSQNATVNPADAVPLGQALQNWRNPDQSTELRQPMEWEWCKACIGHAVALAGLQRSVLVQVAAATYRPFGEAVAS